MILVGWYGGEGERAIGEVISDIGLQDALDPCSQLLAVLDVDGWSSRAQPWVSLVER